MLKRLHTERFQLHDTGKGKTYEDKKKISGSQWLQIGKEGMNRQSTEILVNGTILYDIINVDYI